MCLTASFLATGGFKFELFPNACMVYKHAVVAAFHIYAQHGQDAAKGEFGGHALNSHGNYIVDHGKSWNCDFKFLLEPCVIWGCKASINWA